MIKLCRLRACIAAFASWLVIRRAHILICLIAPLAFAGAAFSRAQNARFDLTGPKVEVRVTRNGVTLPIASVPNLQPNDRLWIHPDLPDTQSVHYLMVLVFLRGTTNPPPDRWFIRIPTWDKKVRAEGAEISVPAEAQQAVLFLAPVTGGDFTTLRSAVQGRPGIFVRASQDLAAAGFEQARIEKYTASMKELSPEQAADPKQLQEHSNLLAATLALKPNSDCIKLPPDQQYTCFTQTGSQNLLDDGHGQSIIDALTGNATAGLIGTVSTTQLAGGGIYSAYVGSIVDLIHIMGTLHTAQYQYIPAIAFPQQESLNLRLNTPPSFHNPKSVIVIGLPSIQSTTAPPLRAADPKSVSCLQKPNVVLPVEGAPLVFSTGFAHNLVLHLNYPAGAKPGSAQQDIPLTPSAFRGGLVLTTLPKRHALPEETPSAAPSAPASPVPPATSPQEVTSAELTGTIKGFWGFDPFTGPTMPLQDAPGKDWKLASEDPSDAWLIAGKDRHVLLTSSGSACIADIDLEPPPARDQGVKDQPATVKESWKPTGKPNIVDVTLDVPVHDAGDLQLAIHQFGESKPATVSLIAYNEPAKVEALHFHAGDDAATLVGAGLEQVDEVTLGGLNFKPAADAHSNALPNGQTEYRVTLPPDVGAPKLPSGQHLTAQLKLHDGRTLPLPTVVEPPRPSVTLIGHADVPPESAPRHPLNVRLSSDTDLPVGDALMFSLKSGQPFPRAGSLEVASPDGALHTILKLADAEDSVILEDPHTLLATFQPLKAFGPSAFGPIHVRALAPDGTAGDWIPLVTLVRLPTLTGLSCPVGDATIDALPQKPVAGDAASSAKFPGARAREGKEKSTDTASKSPADSAASSSDGKPDKPAACSLTGSGLFFIDSIATDAAFANVVRVPEGFVGSSIAVPAPTGAVYYLRLRDDPVSVQVITLPAGPL